MNRIVLGKSEGRGFHLPTDVATQTILIVGKRGSGKSSTATRLAEQLIESKVQIAVLDPPDAWWGLKSSADGRSEGFPVYVFGGRHGDLPLESTAGALMADLLVDDGINAVMSLRQFSNLERSRFSIDFADRLFQRNTRPLMLFCEEAHRLMPQNLTEYGKGSRVEEMLGKMLKLQTEGRTSGIGLTAITQRPANLHKTFTTQSEILIAHRTLGPQDRDAIEGWIKYHRQDEQKEEMLASLAELKTGDAWIWAPDFPEEKPIGLRRVHFLLPETFDSRRTPRPGEHLAEPKHLAAVDLEKLKQRMAATIERAKAEDPKELRAKIRALEAQLRIRAVKAEVRPPMRSGPVQDPRAIARAVRETEVRLSKTMALLEKAATERGIIIKKFQRESSALVGQLARFVEMKVPELPHPEPRQVKGIQHTSKAVGTVQVPAREFPMAKHLDLVSGKHEEGTYLPDPDDVGNSRLPSSERTVLTAIAQYEGGVEGNHLSILTGYKRSTRDAYVARLRAKNMVEDRGGKIVPTESGLTALGSEFEPLPQGEDLQRYWLARLPKGEKEIFEILLAAAGEPVPRETLTEQTGYKRSTRDAYLARMAAKKIVESVGRGEVKAAPLLFE